MSGFDVVQWMAEHGHGGYAKRIHDLQCTADETRAEAGRYGQFCQFTQEALRKIEAEIAEVRREAEDRYDDWRSDPLD